MDALDGLFGELLDITQIDTGGVEARPRDFQLRELFAQLRLHFEPIAFEKGLLLELPRRPPPRLCRPGAAGAHPAQPAANAIRYTDDGGVLVAARAAAAPSC